MSATDKHFQSEHWRADYSEVPILSIEEMYALPEAKEYDSGVYFLWYRGGLVYIGKSRNLLGRAYYQHGVNRANGLMQSTTAKVIPHDKMTCLVLHNGFEIPGWLDGKLTAYERAYFAAYEPYFNEDHQAGFT